MKRSVRVLLSAFAGVAAAGLALTAVSSAEREAEAARAEALAAYGGEVVTVCVATSSLEAGDELDATNVELRDWVADLLPEDACTSLDEVGGREVAERVPKGAVISETYFSRRESAVEVPEGLVAVSVPVQQEYALGGALTSGDEVDVYVAASGVVDRISEAARVIDASTFGTDGSGDLTWVTVAVEPERVEELLAASARGTVSLTLSGLGVDGARGAGGDEAAEDGGSGRTSDEGAAEEDADAAGAAGDPEAAAGQDDEGAAGSERSAAAETEAGR